MTNEKHLTLEECSVIESMLNDRSSFTTIENALSKDRSTISKEVSSL